MSETNPFRLSMLRRSQSPLEDPFESLSAAPLELPTIQHPSGSASTSRSGSVSSTGAVNAAAHRPTNPFRVDLHDTSASPVEYLSNPVSPMPLQDAGSSLEPPSYFESESRRHSEPNLSRNPDEKAPLADHDDSYHKGYEEGMRMARERERQRRREIRERRLRNGDRSEQHSSNGHNSNGHSSNGHSSSGHSERHRSERSSRRSRSKSESAGHHHSSHRSKPKPPPASLDVIDKMDITGIYGGSGFHHDGPFDACAPHRNKASKRIVATPISAFPADGPNNSLAVEDPRVLAFRKEETVYGRNSVDPPPEIAQASFDPTERGAKVHGQQTMGLGSSTFIDGTPASRDAIAQAGRQRSQSLGRSRSLLRRAADDDFDNGEPKSLLSRVRSLRVTRH